MNRVWDHLRFAVWFCGIGYMVLWPLTEHHNGIAAVSLACGPSFTIEFICAPRAGLPLSPGLHLAGMISSAFVVMCLALRPLRWRRFRAPKGGQTPLSIVKARIRRRRAPPPRRYVQPRAHFGLRNPPH